MIEFISHCECLYAFDHSDQSQFYKLCSKSPTKPIDSINCSDAFTANANGARALANNAAERIHGLPDADRGSGAQCPHPREGEEEIS